MLKQKQTVKLPKGTRTLAQIRQATQPIDLNNDKEVAEQFPNQAVIANSKARAMPENNFFINHSVEDIRKKYLQFTVFMEQLNNVLELDRFASVEQFANRIRDIVIADQAYWPENFQEEVEKQLVN